MAAAPRWRSLSRFCKRSRSSGRRGRLDLQRALYLSDTVTSRCQAAAWCSTAAKVPTVKTSPQLSSPIWTREGMTGRMSSLCDSWHGRKRTMVGSSAILHTFQSWEWLPPYLNIPLHPSQTHQLPQRNNWCNSVVFVFHWLAEAAGQGADARAKRAGEAATCAH